MTQKFRSIILALCAIFASSVVEASCPSQPAGYSAATAFVPDFVTYTVYYPATVHVGQPFTILICIQNTSNPPAQLSVSLTNFLPNNPNFTVNPPADCCITTPQIGTVLTTASGGSFTNPALQDLEVMSATITLTATSPGSFTYSPVAGNTAVFSPSSITINAIVCPTITASSFTGCQNGSLSSHVTGGTTPYTFFSTGTHSGGTPTVSSTGLYSFTNPTGSFQFEVTDASGCSSNAATVNVNSPILPDNTNPLLGPNLFFIATGGMPLTQSTQVTGGTPPYNFTLIGTPINGTVTFNPGANTFTFTQTSPGASLFNYSVTDQNGCQAVDPTFGGTAVNNYIYSCPSGINTTAGLDAQNQIIYALCYPPIAYLGTKFPETLTVSNLNPTDRPLSFMESFVPDPAQGSAPGLSYVSNTTPPPGTIFSPTGNNVGGGMGSYGPASFLIPANSDLSFDINILATATGPQSWTGSVTSQDHIFLPFNMQVDPCPIITAGDAAFTGCTGALSGNLNPFVTGGVGPYSFTQAGVSTCSGVLLDNLNPGFFTYTPATGFTGPCSFQYSVVDTNGCTSSIGTVNLAVNQGATPLDGSTFTCENVAVSGTLSASGGTPPYTFAIVANGTLGTAVITDAATGAFTYTPNLNTTGTDSFTFQVTDSAGCVSNVATETVVINPNPATVPFGVSGCVGSTVTGDFSSSVFIGNPPFTFGPTGAVVGGTVTINPSGTFIFTGTPGFSGQGSFDYQVTDASGCIGTGVVDLTLAEPVAGNTSAIACVNGSVTGDVSGLVSGGFPGYTFGPTGSPVGGTVTIDAGGIYTFTAATGFSGTASFDYQATDTLGCIGTGEVFVTVSSPIVSSTSVRDCQNASVSGDVSGLVTAGFPPYTFGPVASASGGIASISPSGIFNFTATTGVTGQGGFQYGVTDSNFCTATGTVNVIIGIPVAQNTGIQDCVNGSVSGDLSPLVGSGFPPYTFSATGAPVGGTVTINPSGIYNFTAASGFRGTGNFAYQANDSNNCIATGDVTVTISSPIAGNTSVRDCVNGAVSGNLSPLVSSGFPPYTFSETGTAVGGVATVNPSGVFTYTGNPGFSGLGDFVYQATDSFGCVGTGLVNVLVASPVALSATEPTICINSVSVGGVASLVSGGFLPYTFGQTGTSVGGIATVNPSGGYIFTGATGFIGTGSFIYQVTDNNNCIGTGLVSIPINSPITSNTSVSTCNDTLNGNLALLVTGGSGDNFFEGLIGPVSCSGASVTISSTGLYSFTAPNTGFTGPCSFVYEVTDANDCIGTGIVTIMPNTAPVANSILLATCFQTPLADTLANSVIGGVAPLTFTQVGATVNGTVVLNPDGSFIFTPNAGFLGTASFQYRVTDSSTPACISNIATVTIEVENCCPACATGSFACVMDSLIP